MTQPPPPEEDNLVLRLLRELRSKLDRTATAEDMRVGFAKVDGRFIEVEEHFADVEKHFSEVDKTLARVEVRLGGVEGLAAKTHGELVSLSRRVDDTKRLTERIEALEAEVKRLGSQRPLSSEPAF